METMSVTTANTVCIRQSNTDITIVNHNGNGKDMPGSQNKTLKIRLEQIKRPVNQ
jgi:hypothetical protein